MTEQIEITELTETEMVEIEGGLNAQTRGFLPPPPP